MATTWPRRERQAAGTVTAGEQLVGKVSAA